MRARGGCSEREKKRKSRRREKRGARENEDYRLLSFTPYGKNPRLAREEGKRKKRKRKRREGGT